jgi:hypothetical protein
MRHNVRRIGVLSLGKVMGSIYAMIGLIIGAIFTVVALLGSVIGSIATDSGEPLLGILFGVGAIIIFPLFYGLIAFLMGMLIAAVYNFAARFTGGLEVELA